MSRTDVAPTPTVPSFEARATKHHAWRGCYPRILTLASDAVTTTDPATGAVTGRWPLSALIAVTPLDSEAAAPPRALRVSVAGAGLCGLGLRLVFSFSHNRQRDEVLDTLVTALRQSPEVSSVGEVADNERSDQQPAPDAVPAGMEDPTHALLAADALATATTGEPLTLMRYLRLLQRRLEMARHSLMLDTQSLPLEPVADDALANVDPADLSTPIPADLIPTPQRLTPTAFPTSAPLPTPQMLAAAEEVCAAAAAVVAHRHGAGGAAPRQLGSGARATPDSAAPPTAPPTDPTGGDEDGELTDAEAEAGVRLVATPAWLHEAAAILRSTDGAAASQTDRTRSGSRGGRPTPAAFFSAPSRDGSSRVPPHSPIAGVDAADSAAILRSYRASPRPALTPLSVAPPSGCAPPLASAPTAPPAAEPPAAAPCHSIGAALFSPEPSTTGLCLFSPALSPETARLHAAIEALAVASAHQAHSAGLPAPPIRAYCAYEPFAPTVSATARRETPAKDVADEDDKENAPARGGIGRWLGGVVKQTERAVAQRWQSTIGRMQ